MNYSIFLLWLERSEMHPQILTHSIFFFLKEVSEYNTTVVYLKQSNGVL